MDGNLAKRPFESRLCEENMKISKFAVVSFVAIFQASSLTVANSVPTITPKQESNVVALFKAFATSDPDKIASASVKYTKAGSAAREFAEMIKNNHATIRYFKSINAFGMPSGLAVTPETKGTSKFSNESITLNSVNNSFDGKYYNFKFDSKGKITDFNVTTSTGSSGAKVSDRIFTLEQTVTNGQVLATGGFIYKTPENKTFIQVEVKNNSTSLKSWSYAGGKYGSAENKYYDAAIDPTGCLYPGQKAFMQSVVDASPVIVAGTGAAFEAPTFEGCGAGSSKSQSTLRFNTK